ncbi:MAG TPA: preprotein translocase subunit SecG [Steroidobacteraceae bacterium]|jgi:preprotein translocase subunit SecG|nr:preprotein translocase subunit SecG [Steroidobacteraceae bacterium]
MSFGRFARLRPFAIERFLMLRGFILAVHVLLALMIIGLVLLQRGKGAEAGAGFGSGASGTVFGARGTSTLFSKLTAVFAGLFFVTSLSLAYLGTRGGTAPTSVLERAAQAATTAPPATTAPQPAAPAPAAPAPAAPVNK